jgi:sarcosine oxidase, subunit gamma
MMEHLGVYLVKHGPGSARLDGPRSSAESLLHALKVAAAAV